MLRRLSRILDALSFDGPAVVLDPDPIDHPAFRGLSLRDLADLPFPRSTPRDGAENAVGGDEPQPLETDAIPHAA